MLRADRDEAAAAVTGGGHDHGVGLEPALGLADHLRAGVGGGAPLAAVLTACGGGGFLFLDRGVTVLGVVADLPVVHDAGAAAGLVHLSPDGGGDGVVGVGA